MFYNRMMIIIPISSSSSKIFKETSTEFSMTSKRNSKALEQNMPISGRGSNPLKTKPGSRKSKEKTPKLRRDFRGRLTSFADKLRRFLNSRIKVRGC